MLKKLRIDELIVFFILSLGFLLVSWWSGVFTFSHEHPEQSPQELSLKHNINVILKGEEITEFQTYNPAYNIYYSVDGGEHFINANASLKSDKIHPPKIDHFPSSLRWRPSASKKEIIKTIQLFVFDPKRKIRTGIQTYVLNPVQEKGKVVYLNCKQSDLLDDVDGLLVGGKASWNDPSFYKSWYYRNANYTQRGMEWEREVNFLVAENGKVVYDQNVGLRISGNATRGFTQKSFRVKARKQYGNSKLKYKLFENEGLNKYESLVIRQSGNDNTETMFADLLMQNLAHGSKVLTQKGEPVTVYINGNYWGQYNLRERIDRYMIAKYEGCKSNEVTILEGGTAALKSGNEEDRDEFNKDLDRWYQSDEISNSTYEEIKKKINVKSFMDYIFFETYYANNDWPHNNSIFFKAKDKKWKWLLNDLDYSAGYPGEENVRLNLFSSMLRGKTVTDKLFQVMISNPVFKEKFVKRCLENLDEYFSEEQITTEYNNLKEIYNYKIDDQIARWRVIESRSDWEQNCLKNLNFLLDRKEIYTEQLKNL